MIRAGGLIDAVGRAAAPGMLLLEGGHVRAAGAPEAIGPVADVPVEDWSGFLLMPGLVNAHAHLDLSGDGVWPPAGDDFRGWVGRVRALRAAMTPESRLKAAETGIQLALAGGTTCIGDIAGHPPNAAVEAVRASSLRGVSFLEVFGIGDGQGPALVQMQDALESHQLDGRGVRVGLSPHSPYSCGPRVFEAAAKLGVPLSTHMAETRAEIELLAEGTGPLRAMLEVDIGVWDQSVDVCGRHPIEALLGSLDRGRMLCAHVNWIEPQHVEMLAGTAARVVYCPRASAAFGHGPPALPHHPWKSLHEAGLTVCLGTDSLLCLDTPNRLSVLDDMRLLYQRDGVAAELLLAMATTHGAAALDIDPAVATLGPEAAGIIACPASGANVNAMLEDVLRRSEGPTWVFSA
jgi:cytosine/adenosine deaminase-related metal-dependent hydrolase